ncbi:MAG TPA: alkaline phosphatase family protein [Actinomycetota bacterium]|nr:alkaline phosphatase family protein [Actinomycetota bacterium]
MSAPRGLIAKISVLALALIVLATVASVALAVRENSVEPIRAPAGAPTEDAMADEIGRCVMGRLWAGYVPRRSGDVLLVPKPFNFLMGAWDLRRLGSADPDTRSTHPNPWKYLAHIPIHLYGPGYIHAGKVAHRATTVGDIAPTYARLLRAPLGDRWAGTPLHEALLPADRRSAPPRLIMTIVYDGGGWNVLRRWPDAWPFQKHLQEAGTLYDRATIGSAPSITGAIHANVGTGLWPGDHALPGNQLRLPDGAIVDAFLQNSDPRYMQAPTVGELFDEHEQNEPAVGMIAYEGWHLGMIGRGAHRRGGDRDFAAIWEADERRWWINEKYYELPGVLRLEDPEKLDRYLQQMDPQDGADDGLWFGQPITENEIDRVDLDDGVKDGLLFGREIEPLTAPRIEPGTPAFARYTGDAIVKTIRSQELGTDPTPDLFYVNLKPTDFGGHIWNMEHPQQAEILREQDRQLQRIVRLLDRQVGRDNYVVLITADHGQQPLPEVSGGWRVNTRELVRDLENRFDQVANGRDLVAKITTTDIYFNEEEMAANRVDPEAVARWLSLYTIADSIPPRSPGTDRVPRARLDDRIFAGVFTASFMQSLSPAHIESLGRSEYAQGRLCPPGVPRVFRR